jgi:transposase InsO family protein
LSSADRFAALCPIQNGAMGIRDRPISPGSPWQNGIAERLIGTLRRECLVPAFAGA